MKLVLVHIAELDAELLTARHGRRPATQIEPLHYG